MKYKILRQELDRQGVSLEEAADTIGCRKDTLIKKLKGKSKVDIGDAVVLHEHLKSRGSLKTIHELFTF